MNDQRKQMPSHAPYPAQERAGRVSRRDCGLCLLWIGIAVMVLVACPLGGWFVWQFVTGYTIHPLRADANTLYLADWSKNLDGWTGGAQWHWKEPDVISSENDHSPPYESPEGGFFLAPYHLSSAQPAIEVDAQIKSLDWCFDS